MLRKGKSQQTKQRTGLSLFFDKQTKRNGRADVQGLAQLKLKDLASMPGHKLGLYDSTRAVNVAVCITILQYHRGMHPCC